MTHKSFHRLLRQRGETVSKLARDHRLGRSHLAQVLAGTRPGPETWLRLQHILTKAEYDLARNLAAKNP